MIRLTARLSAIALFWLSSSAIAAPYGDLWDYWAAHQPASNTSVDHLIWQSILDKHVSASSDGINRVNYRGFSAADKQQLDDYLTYMSALERQLIAASSAGASAASSTAPSEASSAGGA